MDTDSTLIKIEPEVVIDEIGDDYDDDNNSMHQSNSMQTSISQDTTFSDPYSDETYSTYQPNGQPTATEQMSAYLSAIKSFASDTQALESLETINQQMNRYKTENTVDLKNSKLGSNAQSMRNYRSRIRADPVRYQAYKERERLRNKRRCEKRRQDRLAKRNRKTGLDRTKINQLLMENGKSSNNRVSNRLKQKPQFEQMEIRDSDDDYDDVDYDYNDDDDDDDDDDEDDENDDNDRIFRTKKNNSMPKNSSNNNSTANTDILLKKLFTDLETIVNKRLPTNEVTITIPKKENTTRQRLKRHHKSEVDIFVKNSNMPISSNRLALDKIQRLNEIETTITSIGQPKPPRGNDIVDLTELSDDNEESDSYHEVKFNKNFEPEIEIIEYPHFLPVPETTENSMAISLGQNGQMEANKSRTSRASSTNTSGYIDSFVTFVSQKLDNDERVIVKPTASMSIARRKIAN